LINLDFLRPNQTQRRQGASAAAKADADRKTQRKTPKNCAGAAISQSDPQANGFDPVGFTPTERSCFFRKRFILNDLHKNGRPDPLRASV
jgi:hypothetical protein